MVVSQPNWSVVPATSSVSRPRLRTYSTTGVPLMQPDIQRFTNTKSLGSVIDDQRAAVWDQLNVRHRP
jgi:hypothetical protein